MSFEAIGFMLSPMLQDLSREDRLLLLEFVCAFAWTDLKLADAERRFVERLMDRLELDAKEREDAAQWLLRAPSPAAQDPARIPQQHRRVFVESARALIYADGTVDDEERERFDALRAALEA
jgi:uncharacterized tellurite resistance protein B-like protein